MEKEMTNHLLFAILAVLLVGAEKATTAFLTVFTIICVIAALFYGVFYACTFFAFICRDWWWAGLGVSAAICAASIPMGNEVISGALAVPFGVLYLSKPFVGFK